VVLKTQLTHLGPNRLSRTVRLHTFNLEDTEIQVGPDTYRKGSSVLFNLFVRSLGSTGQ